MYGAILGDMIGAPYEFDRGRKTKDFPMFTDESQFTDDTVMTIAVAEALLDNYRASDNGLQEAVVRSMQKCVKLLGFVTGVPLASEIRDAIPV